MMEMNLRVWLSIFLKAPWLSFFHSITPEITTGNFEGIDRHRCNPRLNVNLKKFATQPTMPVDMEAWA